MARNICGLDLGTYEIKVFDKQKDEIWKAKNVIAMQEQKHLFAVGNEAYSMFEKTPPSIQVIFPMQKGAVSHFESMQCLLQNLLKKDRPLSSSEDYVIAMTTNLTEVEKRAFYDLILHAAAKAKSIRIVERGIADAIGMNLDIWNEHGVFIANFGAETTALSILSFGSMILTQLLKTGSSNLDVSIRNFLRYNHGFLIGRRTAETIRKKIDIFEADSNASITVAGRNLLTGIPEYRDITMDIVRVIIKDHLSDCVRAIKSLLERTPPDIRRSIKQKGIYLTGGFANLSGFSSYLEKSLKVPVIRKADSELCAVNGLKKIILNEEYHKLTYSMLDEDYRWLR